MKSFYCFTFFKNAHHEGTGNKFVMTSVRGDCFFRKNYAWISLSIKV